MAFLGPNADLIGRPGYRDALCTPALVVPCGFSRAEGLPLSLQIAAAPFAESLVLRIGHAYQQATDWHERRPPEG